MNVTTKKRKMRNENEWDGMEWKFTYRLQFDFSFNWLNASIHGLIMFILHALYLSFQTDFLIRFWNFGLKVFWFAISVWCYFVVSYHCSGSALIVVVVESVLTEYIIGNVAEMWMCLIDWQETPYIVCNFLKMFFKKFWRSDRFNWLKWTPLKTFNAYQKISTHNKNKTLGLVEQGSKDQEH